MQQPGERSAKRLRRLQPLRVPDVPDVMDCWDRRQPGQRSRPRGCHCLGARARCAGAQPAFHTLGPGRTRPPPWTVSQGCCPAPGLGEAVGAQVSEPGGRSKREEDGSDRRTNQTEKRAGCLGSIPRYHMWEALLRARPQTSVYERGSHGCPEGISLPAALPSLWLPRRGERPGSRGCSCGAHEHSPLSACGTDKDQPRGIRWVGCLACPGGFESRSYYKCEKMSSSWLLLKRADSSDPLTISFQ